MDKLTPERLQADLMKYVKNGVPYMDSILKYADDNEIEIEVLGEIIKRSQFLKELVREEAEKLNMLDKTSRLPIEL